MKLAVTAEGTRGDIYPMLALAKRIEARGDQVVFCAPPDFAEAARSRGLAFRPVGIDIREYLTAEARSLHGGALAMAKAAGQLVNDNLGRQFADLQLAAAGFFPPEHRSRRVRSPRVSGCRIASLPTILR